MVLLSCNNCTCLKNEQSTCVHPIKKFQYKKVYKNVSQHNHCQSVCCCCCCCCCVVVVVVIIVETAPTAAAAAVAAVV